MILEVLEGFLNGNYSRDELFEWYRGICQNFARHSPGGKIIDSESRSGQFIVHSLAFINDVGIVGYQSRDKYFIRDEDIKEYIAELKQLDCDETYGKIMRLRPHQVTKVSRNNYPLVCVNGDTIVKQFKVFFPRGLVDDLGEHSEFAFVSYETSCFFVLQTYRDKSSVFTIFGYEDSAVELVAMLMDVGIEFEQVSFVSDMLMVPTALWRLDDNNNQFLVSRYDSLVEAEFAKRHYEQVRHKQSYYLKPA